MTQKQSLSRNKILRGYQAFSRVLGKGRTLAGGPVRLYYLSAPADRPSFYIGVAVARSIRGSVQRNRFRRLLRESFRMNQEIIARALEARLRHIEMVILFSGPGLQQGRPLKRQDVDKYLAPLLEILVRKL